MNNEQYKRILKQNAVPSGLILNGNIYFNKIIQNSKHKVKPKAQFKIMQGLFRVSFTEVIIKTSCGPLRARSSIQLSFCGMSLIEMYAVVVPLRKKICGRLYGKINVSPAYMGRLFGLKGLPPVTVDVFCQKICLKYERRF